MFLILLLALSLPGDTPVDVEKLVEAARAKDIEGPPDEAARLWEKVTTANPYQAQYWLRRAGAHRSAKQLTQAVAAYAEAHRLGAGVKGTVAYSLACCHAQLGQLDDALRWLRRCLDEGYRGPAQLLTDDALEKLRPDPRFQQLVEHLKPSPTDRHESWRHDLRFYYTELKRRHPDLHRLHTPAEFDAYVKKLHDDIPLLDDAEVEARFIRLGAMAGSGHTALRPTNHRRIAPIELFQFEEGVAVRAVAPEHADLAGGVILKVGDHNVQDALASVEPYISRDNPMAFKAVGPMLLARPRLLYGIGLIPSQDEVTYAVRTRDGREKQATFKTIEVPANDTVDGRHWTRATQKASTPPPLYLKDRNKAYWFEHLDDEKLVYCQYNAVRNQGSESLEKFCTRMFKFIDEHQADYLVVDLRWNGGGNSFLNRPLIEGIIRTSRINQTGKLFVIIGRNTFSAAQNCATDLELHTKATFVGEPTGSCPNSIGESTRIVLPSGRMTGSLADLRWWRGWPMDERVWIPPHLPAPPTLATFLENRDPALEAIRAKMQRDRVKASR